MKWGYHRVCAASRMTIMAVLCVACSQEPTTDAEPPGPSAEALPAVTTLPEGERPSPTPIIVTWTGTPQNAKVQRLSGLVRNTTTATRRVELRLTGMAPSGEIAVRSMGSLEVPPNSAVPVDYALADLPAQSTGMPSTILLSASYEMSMPSTGGTAITRTLQATTPALQITSDANGAAATALDAATQARANSKKPTAERRAASTRLYDAKVGRIVDATTKLSPLGELSPPVVVTIEGQRGSGPPGRANSVTGVEP